MERHSQEQRTLIHTGEGGREGSRCGGIAQARDRSAAHHNWQGKGRREHIEREVKINTQGTMSSVFGRLFGKPKEVVSTLSTLDKLNEVGFGLPIL